MINVMIASSVGRAISRWRISTIVIKPVRARCRIAHHTALHPAELQTRIRRNVSVNRLVVQFIVVDGFDSRAGTRGDIITGVCGY